MMKALKMAGLCLVTVFMVSAMATTVASAEEKPFLLQCSKVLEAKKGKWNNSKCSEEGGTKEWVRAFTAGINVEPGVSCQKLVEADIKFAHFTDNICSKTAEPPKKEYQRLTPAHTFKGKSAKGVKPTLETVGKKTIVCNEDVSEGEFTGNKTAGKSKVTFKGCKSGIVPCKTPGAGAEEIVTKELEGEIGYIHSKKEVEEGKKEVGLGLWPSGRTKAEKEKHEFLALFVEFECTGFAKLKVRGAVIGEVKKINEMTTTPELIFTQKEGKQTFKTLEGVEGGVTQILESKLNEEEKFEVSGEATTENLTTEDAVEASA
jgi:hypothetical protein